MKKLFLWLLLLLTFNFQLGTSVSAQTIDPMNLPKLNEYVIDFSNVLTADQLTELRSIAKAYEDKTSTQIVTVLFPNRNGNELFDIGMKVFKDNQIGQSKINNGLLLVIATEEKKIRIIVGYGLEGSIPDALASNIIEMDVRPAVNNGDFYNAVKGFYTRSINAIDTDESVNYQGSGSSDSDDSSGGLFFLGFIIGMALSQISFFKKIVDKSKFVKKHKTLAKVFSVILSFVFVFIFGAIGLFFLTGLSMIFVGLMIGFVFGVIGLFGGGEGGNGGMFFFGGGGGGFGGGGGGFGGGGGSSGGGGAGD